MPLPRPRDHLLDIEFSSLAGVQRPKALVNVAAKSAELLKMCDKLAANAVLLWFGELSHLRSRLFKDLCHAKPSITNPADAPHD